MWNGGFTTYDGRKWGVPPRSASTYVQVFRSGAVEVAYQRLLIRAFPEHDKIIPMRDFEKRLIAAIGRFVGFQRDVGILPPIVVMLSLFGVKDFALTTGAHTLTDTVIDRDSVLSPDILIEDLTFEPDVVLRPILDFLWQSAGVAGSPNYGADGRWKEGR